jgi:hypothetical protein
MTFYFFDLDHFVPDRFRDGFSPRTVSQELLFQNLIDLVAQFDGQLDPVNHQKF